ncbi:helix-turn-helix domain-containing protein [Saccharothrix hoggarensis]|uniref:Helix-turn-helix domain-containing protein n=1 Tax=Saccharothrix hoggarensis TaxID=913853 RepID=A0ABW3QQN8_9PSEU
MTGGESRDPDGPGAAVPPSLRAVRLALGLSSRAVAEQVGVTTACLLRWERRQRTPSPELVAALAGVLRLPVEQAAAFFAEGTEHPLMDDTMPGYALRALRKDRRVPPRSIAEALRVTVQTVYNWERGGSRLPVRLLEPLARCLGMGIEELVKALRAARRDTRTVVRLRGELASLRDTAGFSQARVADLLGVSRTTLRRWERGEVVPPWQAIRLMATLYQAPLAVVAAAAKAGKPRFLDPENWLPGDLPEVLRVLRQWNGLTQAQVAEHCGTSTATVRGWERARQRPRPSQCHRLERLYRLPHDSLLRAYLAAAPTSDRVKRDAC